MKISFNFISSQPHHWRTPLTGKRGRKPTQLSCYIIWILAANSSLAVTSAKAQQAQEADKTHTNLAHRGSDSKSEDYQNTETEQAQPSLAELAKLYNLKGINFHWPTAADSIFKNFGNIRSTLAKHGFGVVLTSLPTAAVNMLDAARHGPGPLIGRGQSSDQQYWGQRLSAGNSSEVFLLYDLSRWGIPNGQLGIGSVIANSSWKPNYPSQLGLRGLFWYQTLFDKTLEIKLGYALGTWEWVGFVVGGSLTNPLGTAASIPAQMGMAAGPAAQPAARVKWNITDAIYNQVGVLRSLPINGPTRNPVIDNQIYNPSNTNLSVPNGKLLFMNELGYRTPPRPGSHEMWVRGGLMLNASDFYNYRTGGTSSNIIAGYLLADAQLLQFRPAPASAYQGLYFGGTGMWGSPEALSLPEYYEARLYIKAPFKSRPRDIFSVVYRYSSVNQHIQNAVNASAPETGVYANTTSQSYLVAYTVNVVDGIYPQIGLQYAKNPSTTYTNDTGSALSLVLAILVNL